MELTNEDISFAQWFDLVTDELHARGYDGPIDAMTFEFDYDNGLMVGAAVDEFLEDREY